MSRKASKPAVDTSRQEPVQSNQEHRLCHELHVHQIELEVQNETLRESQQALEASRDLYAGLYEFAPVGYLTLGGRGVIARINLTGAALLGTNRSRLIRRDFAAFVAVADSQRWHQIYLRALRQTEAHADELLLQRDDGSSFPALIECRQAAGEVLLTLTDISERRRIEQALARSEESFRRLAQISPAAIFRADPNGACTYANQRCAEIAGRPVEDLVGDGWIEVMHPDDRDATLRQWRQDMSQRQPKPLEWRVRRPDGSLRRVLSEAVAEVDQQGKVLGFISCISDITELRAIEERSRAELAAHRDTLIREVHHRIKNNLQSVAGLLQRELGPFVELNPRLEAAISQVNAIAVVHGLQSADSAEAIRLCDSIRNICKTVADLSQRPVLFHIEHEQTAFRPVHIENSEAVSVALVLNELVLNAVKHSPQGGAAPTVSLSANGSSAQLVIRNALAATHDFDIDIDTGTGLGTGLRLVRSLLPQQGARLTYERDAQDFMLTRLKLTAPVVTQQDHQ